MDIESRKENGFLYLPTTPIIALISCSPSPTTTETSSSSKCDKEKSSLKQWLNANIDLTDEKNIVDNELIVVVSGSEEENDNNDNDNNNSSIKNGGSSSKKSRLAVDFPTDSTRSIKQQQHHGCPNCQIVLHYTDNGNNLRIKCSPYDGTMTQRKSKCTCVISDIQGKNNQKEYQIKSDANLLLGAAISSSRLNQIHIESIQIILHKKICSDNDNPPYSSSSSSSSNNLCFYSASILLTISLSNYKIQNLSSSALLSPSTQFLYSMVQTDWNTYKEIVSLGSNINNSNSNNNNTEKMKDLLLNNNVLRNNFPTELSLQELYQRMNTASKQQKRQYKQNIILESFNEENIPQQQQQKSILITSVPTEVLITYISSYLNSKSLHSFRCTCKYLFHVVCSVIPGLKLKLYPHQTASLSWMRSRESGADDKYAAFARKEKDQCASSSFIAGSLIPFPMNNIVEEQNNGNSQRQMESQVTHERGTAVDCCRGGLLCDDPGLGKTITVLSLILQTFGLTTVKNNKTPTSETAEDDKFDEIIFHAYWKDLPHFSREQILIYILKQVKLSDTKYFLAHNSTSNTNLIVIYKRISTDFYMTQFELFQKDMGELLSCYYNYNEDNDTVAAWRQEATVLKDHLENIICNMKKEKVRSTKESHYKSNRAKANSTVAPLIRNKIGANLKSNLLPSSSTLIVVPSPLIQHWIEQIELHVDFSYCLIDRRKENSTVVYHYDSSKNNLKDRDPMHVQNFIKSHNPLVFVDYGTCHPLPSPDILCQFRIVITTNQRLTSEWKNGNLEDEYRPVRYSCDYGYHESTTATTMACPLLKIQWLRLVVDEGHSMGRSRSNAIIFASWINAHKRWVMTGTPTPSTSLSSQSGLKNIFGLLHFLKQNPMNKDCFHSFICQPWNEGLLVSFIRLHYVLSHVMIRHTKLDVVLPRPEFRTTLVDMSQSEILSYNTIVSTTRMNILLTGMESITSGFADSLLNARNFRQAREAMSNIRKICCGGNDIVVWLPSDILFDEGEQEDELPDNDDNDDNGDGDEPIVPRTKKQNKFKIKMKEIFKTISNLQDAEIKVVENYMYRTAIQQERTGCMSCGYPLSILVITPCGHMVCVECFDSKTKICPVCDKIFDADDCQLLQPGFKPTWKSHLEHQPIQLITAQNNEGGDEVIESSPSRNIVIGQNPPSPRVVRRKINKKKSHKCIFPPTFVDGTCELCSEEHDCDFRYDSKCSICCRAVEDCPPDESKYSILIKKMNKLLTHYNQITQYRRRSLFVNEFSPVIKKEENDVISSPNISVGNYSHTSLAMSPFSYSSAQSPITLKQEYGAQSSTSSISNSSKRTLKIIVFSQFRDTLNCVGHRLIRRFGRACIAEFFGSVRTIELHKFTYSPTCFCMLLTKDGSHGLDLSFVTHIFFMEPVLDQDLESQVVSRAYRMGAKDKVVIEKLIAKASVEESILALNGKNDDQVEKEEDSVAFKVRMDNENIHKKNGTTKAEKEVYQARIHYLLTNCKLIRDEPKIQHTNCTKPVNASYPDGGHRKRVLFNV